ncbi:hypothetical protein CEXT_323481 [Caerostris extrusa]|uniref:Uncharacterized protein n=1 Tax=Caerostris extrusa TaxID=172846 RepID=A0AAV4S7Z7_CAEEX|nr:hypothetical protein CEXT_323481 [Caerostris extrusa]
MRRVNPSRFKMEKVDCHVFSDKKGYDDPLKFGGIRSRVDVILNEFSSDQIMLSQRLINERGRFVNVGRSDGTQTLAENLRKISDVDYRQKIRFHVIYWSVLSIIQCVLPSFVDDPNAAKNLLRGGISSGEDQPLPRQE